MIGRDQPIGWRASPFPPPDPRKLGVTLGDALLAVARERPAAPALIDRGRRMSFAELVGRIGALADLVKRAPAPAGPVALLQSAGGDAVAAWIAAAAAGRPFLLLEPGNPEARNRALIGAAAATILLCDDGVRAPTGIDGLTVIGVASAAGPRPLSDGEGLGVDAPAMIFPTSGSTGEPKLVVYAHRTLQAKVQASIPLMGARPDDVTMIAGSHANYGFLHHAMVFLLAGGCVCLQDVSAGRLLDLFDAIVAHGVRNVRFTPSLFRAAAAHPASHGALRQLRAARFSGEPFLPSDYDLARRSLAPDALIQNVYGSTESQLFLWSSDRDPPARSQNTTLGQIYPNAEFQIHDDDGTPLGVGEAGELVISAPFQALGDCRDGAIDGARFAPDPRGAGRRLCRTGDVVRIEPDGSLVMLGRRDRVVKVNGHRISLMEIENLLRAMPGCAEAVVLAQPSAAGTRLAAFLIAVPGAIPRPDPRAFLSARVPPWMSPARCIWVDAMPLLPSGKVDGAALLQHLAQAPVEVDDRGRDGLADLWRRALEISDCGPNESFFDLGGDSLKLLSLSLALEGRFKRKLAVEAFLEAPTLAGLARMYGLATPALWTGSQALSRPSFTRLRRATGEMKGVALLPPWGMGRRNAGVLLSGAFHGFDIWGCDVESPDGNLTQGSRWIEAAIRIAEALERGEAPAPQIVVGASLAGFIGWLVDRVLSRSAGARRVICLDTLPMHREPRYQEIFEKAHVRLDGREPTPMLSIHRVDPGAFGVRAHFDSLWRDEDAVRISCALNTIDHGDINAKAALEFWREPMDRFAEGEDRIDALAAPRHPIPTLGGRLFELLAGNGWPDPAEIESLVLGFPDTGPPTSARALMFLATAMLDVEVALGFARRHAAQRSEFGYAAERLAGLPAAKCARIGARPEAWPSTAGCRVVLNQRAAINYAVQARAS